MSLSCHNREKNFFQGQKTKLTIKHIYIPYIWKCFPYTFIFMQIKLFYIFKVLHEDSFWKRVTNELGNNPVRSFTLERTHWLGDFNVSVKRIHYWPSWREGFGSLHEHSLINVWSIHNTSYDIQTARNTPWRTSNFDLFYLNVFSFRQCRYSLVHSYLIHMLQTTNHIFKTSQLGPHCRRQS